MGQTLSGTLPRLWCPGPPALGRQRWAGGSDFACKALRVSETRLSMYRRRGSPEDGEPFSREWRKALSNASSRSRDRRALLAFPAGPRWAPSGMLPLVNLFDGSFGDRSPPPRSPSRRAGGGGGGRSAGSKVPSMVVASQQERQTPCLDSTERDPHHDNPYRITKTVNA